MNSVEEIKLKVELVTAKHISKNKRVSISKIEGLHFLDLSAKIFELLGDSSERKLAALLGISKSEIHRLSKIAMLSEEAQELVRKRNLDKWFAYSMTSIPIYHYPYIIKEIANGNITNRRKLSLEIRKRQGPGYAH